MNERIEQLAEQAGFGLHSDGEIYTAKLEHLPITENMEKFAELIVKECLMKVNGAKIRNESYDELIERIKEDFGVE